MSARAISQGHTSDFGASIRPWIGESPTLHCADRLWALLVYDAEEPLKAVEQILGGQGMSTRRVRRCSEAIAALGDSDPPKLVVTDTSLPWPLGSLRQTFQDSPHTIGAAKHDG